MASATGGGTTEPMGGGSTAAPGGCSCSSGVDVSLLALALGALLRRRRQS